LTIMSNGKKIAFLDRDGVINNKAAAHKYVTKVFDFKFNRGIFALLRELQEKGYEIIILTNQRGIARKMLSLDDLRGIHNFMTRALEKRRIKILDIFYCPHDLDECTCRKPKPGLLIAACKKYEINVRDSILISDSPDDVLMGEKFGLAKCALIQTDKPNVIL
jgi:D-glycero-D-manno-heptose 1,7-bisphosphate phosphatase